MYLKKVIKVNCKNRNRFTDIDSRSRTEIYIGYAAVSAVLVAITIVRKAANGLQFRSHAK